MNGPEVISGVINRAVLEIRRGRESCVVSELYMAQLFLIVVMKPNQYQMLLPPDGLDAIPEL
jgi:hypothetical protein